MALLTIYYTRLEQGETICTILCATSIINKLICVSHNFITQAQHILHIKSHRFLLFHRDGSTKFKIQIEHEGINRKEE